MRGARASGIGSAQYRAVTGDSGPYARAWTRSAVCLALRVRQEEGSIGSGSPTYRKAIEVVRRPDSAFTIVEEGRRHRRLAPAGCMERGL